MVTSARWKVLLSRRVYAYQGREPSGVRRPRRGLGVVCLGLRVRQHGGTLPTVNRSAVNCKWFKYESAAGVEAICAPTAQAYRPRNPSETEPVARRFNRRRLGEFRIRDAGRRRLVWAGGWEAAKSIRSAMPFDMAWRS
jgi:hypothetical protein